MTQAKVLTQEEVERVLQYLGKKQHAMRNQCMFLLTHGCGVRIKELVSMRICDVMDRNGQINQEVHLNRTQTKGDRGRTVYLSDKMRELIRNYLCERFGLQDLMVVGQYSTASFFAEDIFFCLRMIKHNAGRLAPFDVAKKFSVESKFELGTLGYHRIDAYLSEDEQKQIKEQYK